ncbi:hypothetical protein BD560DRAFT_402109 [Blakeslea trispora]|nr:hypothetical protein BD560DRAFT_402109 [Blakeslea trispora]
MRLITLSLGLVTAFLLGCSATIPSNFVELSDKQHHINLFRRGFHLGNSVDKTKQVSNNHNIATVIFKRKWSPCRSELCRRGRHSKDDEDESEPDENEHEREERSEGDEKED